MLLSLRAALRRGNPEDLIQKSLLFRAGLLRRKLLATTGTERLCEEAQTTETDWIAAALRASQRQATTVRLAQ